MEDWIWRDYQSLCTPYGIVSNHRPSVNVHVFCACSLLILDLHWEIELLMLSVKIISLYWSIRIVLACCFVLGDRCADFFVFDFLIGQLHVRYKYTWVTSTTGNSCRQDIVQYRQCTCKTTMRRVPTTIVEV